MDEDYHPELADYEPFERSGRPRRGRLMRAFVVLVVLALVAPAVATTVSVARSTAVSACAYWASVEIASQRRSEARFELGGPGGIGWECYAHTAAGEEFVRSLGLIPVAPSLLGVGAAAR
ncbi:MAG: hypothetical protein QM635_07425 [Microbacteriaceae bacterium]